MLKTQIIKCEFFEYLIKIFIKTYVYFIPVFYFFKQIPRKFFFLILCYFLEIFAYSNSLDERLEEQEELLTIEMLKGTSLKEEKEVIKETFNYYFYELYLKYTTVLEVI